MTFKVPGSTDSRMPRRQISKVGHGAEAPRANPGVATVKTSLGGTSGPGSLSESDWWSQVGLLVPIIRARRDRPLALS
ncbi:hypothetical protein MPLSOD_260052 [Mesorhizobium sp. SOD10]|nr:hypothetical protein MPLSOD_260052 [Mesorhizobium sp. SOD10]